MSELSFYLGGRPIFPISRYRFNRDKLLNLLLFLLIHDKNVFHWLSENWFYPKTLKEVQFSSIFPFRDGIKNREKFIFLIFCRVLSIFYKSISTKKAPYFYEACVLGGRPVSNRRPLEPQSSALTN